jgi:hypothetical protein
MGSEAQPCGDLESARAARTEDLIRPSGGGSEVRRLQVIAIAAEIGDVENVENLADQRQPDIFPKSN